MTPVTANIPAIAGWPKRTWKKKTKSSSCKCVFGELAGPCGGCVLSSLLLLLENDGEEQGAGTTVSFLFMNHGSLVKFLSYNYQEALFEVAILVKTVERLKRSGEMVFISWKRGLLQSRNIFSC